MAKREKNKPGDGTQVTGTGKITSMSDALRAVEQKEGKVQRRPILKRRRSGQILTREQVKAIKAGRKLLKKELKARGLKGKEELELMASSMGLYYDKGIVLPFLFQLLRGKALWALGGALGALLAVLFLYSAMTQLRGHFTINMSEGMFQEGFVLSETVSFYQPTTHLFSTPAENVPCISINSIPNYIDQRDGSHNDNYFAYTFYVRNEGTSVVGYDWELELNSESNTLSDAIWVMIFEDGKMLFYAKPGEDGQAEALPAFDDNTRGYINPALRELNAFPEEQYELMAQRGQISFYRLIPKTFLDDWIVSRGTVENVEPQEVHKYTVVIWLEGDDPDCTDELIGGHVGMEINMKLVSEESEDQDAANAWQGRWDAFWDNLKFWKG